MTSGGSFLNDHMRRWVEDREALKDAFFSLQDFEGVVLSESKLFRHPEFRIRPGFIDSVRGDVVYQELYGLLQSGETAPSATLLRNVEVVGNGMAVLGEKGVLKESSYLGLKTFRQFRRTQEMVEGNQSERLARDKLWIVGSSAASRNYWHWVAQALPAILQGIEVARSNPHLGEWHLLTGPLLPFQHESLRALGIPTSKIREVGPNVILRADQLLYSTYLTFSWPSGSYRRVVGEKLSSWSWAVQESSGAVPPDGTKLYVSRVDSTRRPIRNEEEIIGYLHNRGFNIITPGEMSVREQVRAFSEADLIVGGHGAGLTNILFSREGTRVCELANDAYPSPANAAIGATAGCHYWVSFFESDRPESPHEGGISIGTRVLGELVDAMEES